MNGWIKYMYQEYRWQELPQEMCTIQVGVKSKHSSQISPTVGVIHRMKGKRGAMFMCVHRRLVSVNLTVVLSYSWDICFDIPPVKYT